MSNGAKPDVDEFMAKRRGATAAPPPPPRAATGVTDVDAFMGQRNAPPPEPPSLWQRLRELTTPTPEQRRLRSQFRGEEFTSPRKFVETVKGHVKEAGEGVMNVAETVGSLAKPPETEQEKFIERYSGFGQLGVAAKRFFIDPTTGLLRDIHEAAESGDTGAVIRGSLLVPLGPIGAMAYQRIQQANPTMGELEKGRQPDIGGAIGTTLTELALTAALPKVVSKTVRGVRGLGREAVTRPEFVRDLVADRLQSLIDEVDRKAYAAVQAKFPKVTRPVTGVREVVEKALADKIRGTPEVPKPLGTIIGEGKTVRMGPGEGVSLTETIDALKKRPNADPELIATLEELAGSGEMPFEQAHGFRTEIGRQLVKRGTPRDVKAALGQAYDGLEGLLRDAARAEGKEAQFVAAQKSYADFIKKWRSRRPVNYGGSPLLRVREASNADTIFKQLTGSNASRVARILEEYAKYSENPKAIRSIVQTAKRLEAGRGLLEVRGLAHLGVPYIMAHALGIPYAQAMGMKLGAGYVLTRPRMYRGVLGAKPPAPTTPVMPIPIPPRPTGGEGGRELQRLGLDASGLSRQALDIVETIVRGPRYRDWSNDEKREYLSTQLAGLRGRARRTRAAPPPPVR